jgi:hypothetical protein
VELLGVLAGSETVADHGVFTDANEAAGLADAYPFSDVLQDFDHLVLGQSGVEQRRALAFGEPIFASAAIQQAALLGAVAHTHSQVAVTALTIVRAILVLTAEVAQVIHDRWSSGAAKRTLGLSEASKYVTKPATGDQY